MTVDRPVALVTGASRGIGAATALALAARGYSVAITYRNKESRAVQVVAEIERHGVSGIAVRCDITCPPDIVELAVALRAWSGRVDLLVLNASGGLERDLVEADPDYPRRVNRDGQLAVLDAVLPLFVHAGTVVFVTSHWAHLHGRVEQLPAYGVVAQTKWEGEQVLRARRPELTDRGIRLLVVTGDLVEGTITPRLLERAGPGLSNSRKALVGGLPTVDEMGEAIAAAAMDRALPAGHTVVMGGSLESLT
jgi:NAD(P)-dependent dehydrogenase (short-subunit alcohol dehydrogenase family)